MNGVHDMGGMQDMGPIQADKNEPVFRERWEARIFAMNRAMGAWRKWNLDASRHERELIPPAEYLRMSYYEKWLSGLVELLAKSGLVTRAEIESGTPEAGSSRATPPLTAEMVPAMIARGTPANRDVPVAARFKAGQRVRGRNINPTGHTRLPRYARGKLGTVELIHGCHAYPDSVASGRGDDPQWLYTVVFDASEIWGADADPTLKISIDAFEPYLEPA